MSNFWRYVVASILTDLINIRLSFKLLSIKSAASAHTPSTRCTHPNYYRSFIRETAEKKTICLIQLTVRVHHSHTLTLFLCVFVIKSGRDKFISLLRITSAIWNRIKSLFCTFLYDFCHPFECDLIVNFTMKLLLFYWLFTRVV